jgi:16S rRNA (uracil1498-N3)-methyltransferase
VLRLQMGDALQAFDGVTSEYELRLTAVSPLTVAGRVVQRWTTLPVSLTSLVLGQAIPKGPKMDLIVEKCSELGLTTLVPLYTERTVPQNIPKRAHEKLGRWHRIAEAAAKQCGRQTLLEIHNPMSLKQFCADYQAVPVKLICWAKETQQSLAHGLDQQSGQHAVAVLVGPEGGWSEQEISLAQAHGFRTAHLGPLTLRTETAAMVVTSLIRYHLGDFELQRNTA